MKIVADERIAALDATFAQLGTLIKAPGRSIDRSLLCDADALITRTVTRVDQALLEGTNVRFVGTATIGSDHLDTEWLDHSGIAWATAPGCNADATAQYTLAIFLLACRRLGKNPLTQRFGIVGCGNVGGRLRRLLESLDIEVLACDPPLEARGIEGFCTMEEALDCDTVSLHVPLNRGGPWPTHHMLDEPAFKRLSTDTLLINACRGDVVQGRALKDWLSKGGQAALDVWPGEPDIDPELVRLASVATPHVAGYSLEGKLRATAMVHQALCAHFGVQQSVDLTPAAGPRLNLDLMTQGEFDDIVLQVCPVERDDRALREQLDEADAHARIAAYDALRSHYPARREFGAWSLDGNLAPGVSQTLRKLGFSLPPP